MTRIIDSPTELLPLVSRAGRRGVSRVALSFAHDPRDERAINSGLRACGCEVGSIFVMAALLLLAVAFACGWRTSGWTVAAIVFGSALAGKIAGLALAEWRLRAAISRLNLTTARGGA